MSYQDVAVTVQGLYKSFKLPHEQHSGIKQLIVNFFKRKKGYEVQHVLNDVSFEIQKGEFFGIVGRNGSGKSTLLKLLAGIYTADKGLVHVNGALTPFIELGVGFNPELTGRENVFLNGALLGFSREEMREMYDQIVEFAELDKFMDQKLKNYSSGMQVRLAFSIAIRADTPVLLIDEVLAVGDSEFQSKCYAEFRKLKESEKTIIFVTHDMSAVERFCDRVLVLRKGEVDGIYSPGEAAVIYQKMNTPATKGDQDAAAIGRWGSGEVTIKNVTVMNHKTPYVVEQGRDILFEIGLDDKNTPKDITIGLAFHDEFGSNIAGPNSNGIKLNTSKKVFRYTIPKLSFVPGRYKMTVAVYDENSEHLYEHLDEALNFTVSSDNPSQHGKINVFGKWS